MDFKRTAISASVAVLFMLFSTGSLLAQQPPPVEPVRPPDATTPAPQDEFRLGLDRSSWSAWARRVGRSMDTRAAHIAAPQRTPIVTAWNCSPSVPTLRVPKSEVSDG